MTDLLIPAERFDGRIENFGFEFLSFQALRLRAGDQHPAATGARRCSMACHSPSTSRPALPLP